MIHFINVTIQTYYDLLSKNVTNITYNDLISSMIWRCYDTTYYDLKLYDEKYYDY